MSNEKKIEQRAFVSVSYAGNFKLELGNDSNWFESFECPIHKAKPRCEFCGLPMSGTAMHAFCSAGCAHNAEMILELREQMHWSTIAVKQMQLKRDASFQALAF
jgi:hypothetical protein